MQGPEGHAGAAQGQRRGRAAGAGGAVRSGPRPCAPGAYFMPLRSTWLAAMSMTLMMKAMAKAQMRLFRTHVWRICWLEQAVAAATGEQQRDRRDSQAMDSGAACPSARGAWRRGVWRRRGRPPGLPTPSPGSAPAPPGVPGGHSLSTSTGHSSAVPRWLSSSVMMMFSMSFMDRCSQKVS